MLGGPARRAESLFAAADWNSHALGPRDQWPTSLKSLLRSLLASPESMYLVWGEHRAFFFNDAYAPNLGPRLYIAMGARFEELWADAYASVEPMFLKALKGQSSRITDLPVPMGAGACRRRLGGRFPTR